MNLALSRRLAIVVGRALANTASRVVRVYASSSRSAQPTVVVHLDKENHNAHNNMVNDPAYGETVVNPDAWPGCGLPVVTDKQFHGLITQDFGLRPADDVCDDFLKVSVYAAGREFGLVDPLFDSLRKRLIAVLPHVTDQQLISIFRLIPLWNTRNAKDPVFYELWSAFDKQCIDRYKQWSLNKMLLFMDHWYIMKLSRLSNFVWLGVRKLARKPSRLNSKQLVQMMFYANTSRKFLPTLPIYDIEQEIFSHYNDFNINELGIVSLGFFKTQTPIRNQDLVRNLYKSVISEISNIHSMELASFLKILRYCTKHKNADFMYQLMDVLVEKVDKVNLVCCTHIALLGTNLLIKHERLLKKISQRTVDEISQARIKDLERIMLSLTMLNYNPQTTPCIFETVVNELRSDARNNEFEQHIRCYAFTLSYLAMYNIHPYDCISKVLKTETLHKCFGKKLSRFTVPRDILSLNNSLLIECPDYTGPLLPDTLRESCNNHLAWHIPTSNSFVKENPSDENFKSVYTELVRLFKNESYLHVCYPLPHHPKADILFCINSDGKPVTIPKIIKTKIVLGDFQRPPELGKWFAIMILVRNSVLYYSNKYNGLTSCKIRQLEKLGYEPILLSPSEVTIESNIQKVISEKFKIHGISL